MATIVAVVGFVALRPRSDWGDPMLLAVMFLLAVVALQHGVSLPTGIRFDASTPLALIGVALVGPLPTLAVLVPARLIRTGPVWRAGNFANFASDGLHILTAAVLLSAYSPVGAAAQFAWLTAIGLTQLVVNWAIGPALYGTLWLGQPLRTLAGMLRDAFPAGAAMVILAAAAVVGYGSLGISALALFALVAVLPQTALTMVARTRLVTGLDPLTASRSYGAALSEQLGLKRDARREVDAVITLAHERGVSGDAIVHLTHSVIDPGEASCAAGHVTEWWNGAGVPAGLTGEIIPYSARIAEVARTWAALTAADGPKISQVDALAHLSDAAGIRLDPGVVDAAYAVVAQERLCEPDVGLPDPRVPAIVRRAFVRA